MLLSAEHLSHNYATKQLLNDASLFLNEGEKIGIIGINGTGKSTLLKILAGVETPDTGEITLRSNAKISYLAQNPEMQDRNTVLEQVFAHFPAHFRELKEYEVKSILNRLGITDHSALVGTLSGGQRKRVALAAALIAPADILILDEPTNHLDSDMVLWLESWLKAFRGGIIMITHDRYFLENVATKITELSHTRLYSYEANYSKYLQLKAERAEMEQASERKRQSILRREYQWIMQGPKARGTKSRERIERYEELKNQSGPAADTTVQMLDAAASRMGKKLVELDEVSKSFDGRCVLQPFTYHLQRKDRIGIVGHNGAGKSTLLNLIAGKLEPDSGTVARGETMRIGYFTQEGRELDLNQRVYDFIRQCAAGAPADGTTLTASQMLERFLFGPELQYLPIGKLSGGERRRLFLLSILISAPNVLLLDEPTNDLDIDTLTILEDYLESFPGAVIAVSHDRYFLDKMASHIFEVAPGGVVNMYTGGYSDYLEKKAPAAKEKKEKAPAEPQSRRPEKQRKLKMTFKEAREFETIDDDIAALEAAVAQCEQDIEANARDYGKLSQYTAQLEQLKQQLEEKTDRWVYLNDLAERIAAENA